MVVVGALLCAFFYDSEVKNPNFDRNFSPEVGSITSSNGLSQYRSKRYGLKFSFPSDWEIGDNRIDYGSFQISTSTEKDDNKPHTWVKGQSKIEMVLLDNSLLSDEGVENVEKIPVVISGQPAYYFKMEKIYSYRIKVPSYPNKSLAVSFYGDDINYPVFENILESIVWTK